MISTFADGAFSVFSTDLDGDGDTDILSASFYDNKIAWYENLIAQDCNDNNIPDECDIRDGTSRDCQANGVPDECEVMGDFDNNGVVNLIDYGMWQRNLAGPGVTTDLSCFDFDGDLDIDVADFALLQTLIFDP